MSHKILSVIITIAIVLSSSWEVNCASGDIKTFANAAGLSALLLNLQTAGTAIKFITKTQGTGSVNFALELLSYPYTNGGKDYLVIKPEISYCAQRFILVDDGRSADPTYAIVKGTANTIYLKADSTRVVTRVRNPVAADVARDAEGISFYFLFGSGANYVKLITSESSIGGGNSYLKVNSIATGPAVFGNDEGQNEWQIIEA
jgi:hypothetical protein